MKTSERVVSSLLVIAFLLVGALVYLAYQLGIPTTAAGMAAKQVCSGTFVAQRDPQDVIRDDLLPASAILRLVSINVDQQTRRVSASLPGSPKRLAVHRGALGCVLLAPGSVAIPPAIAAPAAGDVQQQTLLRSTSELRPADDNDILWPAGSAALPERAWPLHIDKPRLKALADLAFSGPQASSTSPSSPSSAGPNTRAIAVIHRGRLLLERYAVGFDRNTPQLGWSMAKSVLSLLAWTRFSERGISTDAKITSLMQRVPKPVWAGEWLRDSRADITLDHLMTMRDGLDHEEGYSVLSAVPHMLWYEADIGHYASTVSAAFRAGEHWRYSSAVSNLLARVLRDQFSSDRAYWQYPMERLFKPIAARSAVLETDAAGTFIASSYLWATPQDWARIAWLMLNDGKWAGRQLMPSGWLAYALEKRTDGNGAITPYGAHVWRTGEGNQLKCSNGTKLPPNGFFMSGHWGQTVAVFPEQETVIVRMGWTTDKSQWNACDFTAKVLQTLQ